MIRDDLEKILYYLPPEEKNDSIINLFKEYIERVCRDEFNNYTENAEEIEQKITRLLEGLEKGEK